MPSEASLKPIEMLMVEDSPTDVLITREALSQARVRNIMHVVRSIEHFWLSIVTLPPEKYHG